MPTADPHAKPLAEPTLLRMLAIAAGLAASAYLAQASIADSPYWIELSDRPLGRALQTAVAMVDWVEGGKVVVVLGTSLAVMIDSGRRLFARPTPPSRPVRPRSAQASHGFGLETAR